MSVISNSENRNVNEQVSVTGKIPMCPLRKTKQFSEATKASLPVMYGLENLPKGTVLIKRWPLAREVLHTKFQTDEGNCLGIVKNRTFRHYMKYCETFSKLI